jgi:hypothetical protein
MRQHAPTARRWLAIAQPSSVVEVAEGVHRDPVRGRTATVLSGPAHAIVSLYRLWEVIGFTANKLAKVTKKPYA